MAVALSNVGTIHRQRQRARLQSEAVDEADRSNTNTGIPSEEEGLFIDANTRTIATTTEPNNNNNTVDIEGGGGGSGSNEQGGESSRSIAAGVEHADGTTESDEDEEDAHSETAGTSRHTMALRRRSRLCIGVCATECARFVLPRLWLLALLRLWMLAWQDGDFGLILLCLVITSWTARWIIANYLEHPEIPGSTSTGTTTNEVGRDDLRMLSFQAQLALAIMESQRQMMQGGYGHPDGVVQTPGVSDEAKSKWTMFSYKAARDKKESRRGSYGSVPLRDTSAVNKPGYDEEPHCSICLGEYEEGEQLAKLPCAHIYHDECINSWCSNHIRCPLCNYDLESGAAESV